MANHLDVSYDLYLDHLSQNKIYHYLRSIYSHYTFGFSNVIVYLKTTLTLSLSSSETTSVLLIIFQMATSNTSTLVDLEDEQLLERISTKVVEHNARKRLRSDEANSSNDSLGDGDCNKPEIISMLKIVKEELSAAMTKINTRLDSVCEQLETHTTKLDTISSTVEKHIKVIANIQTDLGILRRETNERCTKLNNTLTEQGKDLKATKQQLHELSSQVRELKKDNLQHRRNNIDIQARMRRNNLLFFGITESKGENCEEKLLHFIKEKLGIQEQPVIQRAHRFGKPTPTNVIGSKANRPRPIICLFLDHKQKELIKSKRFSLQAPFGMADDLPREIREARKTLQGEMNELKKQGKRVTIAYPCKLICEGKVVHNIDIGTMCNK